MAGFSYYQYEPSMPAAVVAMLAFLITSLFHSYQLTRTRSWYLIPLIVGGYSKFPFSSSCSTFSLLSFLLLIAAQWKR